MSLRCEQRDGQYWYCSFVLVAVSLLIIIFSGVVQAGEEPLLVTQDYKKLSLKELMELEVTSVSRRPEKLSESASAIQVITQEDINRSGATSIPEILRLASNLEVFQIDANNWAISARGFNSSLANKLLVMIDGRTIYTPLFAGVFWDVQDTLLQDIDRIEVISGPGATSWGANAVNGVINIITKSAKDTKGLLLSASAGNELRDVVAARYGGLISSNIFYRVYSKHVGRYSSLLPDGREASDERKLAQGGFRFDWASTEVSTITIQGDIYDGETQTIPADLSTSGGNLIGRWAHVPSENESYTAQFYFDHTNRDSPGSFQDSLNTFDFDFQQRFSVLDRHDVVWGVGYRLYDNEFTGSPSLAFLPPNVTHQLFSAFIQDEFALIKNELHIGIGTKLEHNDYTGLEVQPGARIAWKINQQQNLWGAVSRAVRSPSRIDRDLFTPKMPPFVIAGGPNFVSEEVIAYEVGYRIQPQERLFVTVASFYNDYDKIRSVEKINPPVPFPIVIANGQEGKSYGAEITADYRFNDRIRLWAGYTELRIDVEPKPGSTDRTFGAAESRDAKHRLHLRASFDLPGNFEFDSAFRAISEIATDDVPAYGELDLRFAWLPIPRLELAIVGRNLLHDHHPEFNRAATRREIERAVYGRIVWRL